MNRRVRLTAWLGGMREMEPAPMAASKEALAMALHV